MNTKIMESTIGKYCYNWSLAEAKSPAIFKDFTICSVECAKYSNKYNTCIDYAFKEIQIQKLLNNTIE